MGATQVPKKDNWFFATEKQLLKDKNALIDFHFGMALTKTLKIFEYEGLPDTIPFRELEKILQLNGFAYWLKKDGKLFVCYQEGDVMPKTVNSGTTVFAKALDSLGIPYDVEDITKDTYDLLKKKRETAIKYQSDLESEGNKEWFDLLMIQTDCVTEPYELFAGKMARYVYTVCKNGD